MSIIKVFSYNLRMDSSGDGINAFSLRKEFVLETFPKYDADIIKKAIDENKLIGGAGSATRGKSKNYRNLYKFFLVCPFLQNFIKF